LEEWRADEILPGDCRVGIEGGSSVGEMALLALELGESIQEFEGRPREQQDWLLATRRIKAKISAIKMAESREKARK